MKPEEFWMRRIREISQENHAHFAASRQAFRRRRFLRKCQKALIALPILFFTAAIVWSLGPMTAFTLGFLDFLMAHVIHKSIEETEREIMKAGPESFRILNDMLSASGSLSRVLASPSKKAGA